MGLLPLCAAKAIGFHDSFNLFGLIPLSMNACAVLALPDLEASKKPGTEKRSSQQYV